MTCTYGLRSNVVFSGLEDGEIGCIDHDYERDGLREKIFQMIAKWCSKYGKGATVGKFVKACNSNHMYTASKYLCAGS